MSGLLGNKGPGIMGKLFNEAQKKGRSKEKPGFSDTKVMKNGKWVSINKGNKGKRDRYMVGSALTGLF